MCVFLGRRSTIIRENRAFLHQHPPKQAPDRVRSRMAVSVPRKWSKSHVALCFNHQGICCPHDERVESIKRAGLREEKEWDRREKRGRKPHRLCRNESRANGETVEECKTESGMAKHCWREERIQEWKMSEKRAEGNSWRGNGGSETEEEGTIRARTNGELRTSGLKAS